MNRYFPQINRIIPAQFFDHLLLFMKYSAMIVILITIYLNFHTQFYPENKEYVKLRIDTLRKISDPLPYTKLAFYLEDHGFDKEAKENFQFARFLAMQKNVLGENDSVLSFFDEREKQKQGFINETGYWQKIIEEKPEFRDGYLQLGILYYQLGEYDSFEKSISKALEIDPFYERKEFLTRLSKKQN